MSRFTDAVQPVRKFAEQPITTCAAFPSSDQQFFQDPCFKNLMQLCHKASPAERDEVLGALAPVIATTPDVFQASRLAMLCGILVEWGADPALALDAILDRLTTLLTMAQPMKPDEEAQRFLEAPDAVKAWKGLRYAIMPAMTMLCLDVKLRQSARQSAALLEGINGLADRHGEVKFLKRLLDFADGAELIVLHPAERKGYRVRIEAIASNFHLFTLLQDALVGDPAAGLLAGHRASRMVLATARGEIPHDRIVSDSAVFHYVSWDGTAVQGEESPRAIPTFEEDRVILVGPPLAAAPSWESTYFTNLHDALRSKVEIVEILSAGEVEVRLGRMGRHGGQEPKTD